MAGARLSIRGVFILNGNINAQGGGILNAGTLVVDRVTMAGNTASDGGAISNSGNLASGPVTARITRSVFTANTATNIGGGGIVNVTGTLSLIGSLVNGNSAPAGGGFNNQPQAVTDIVQSTLSANSAGTNGGGIDRPAGTVTLTDSLVRNNTPNNCNPPNAIPGCVN